MYNIMLLITTVNNFDNKNNISSVSGFPHSWKAWRCLGIFNIKCLKFFFFLVMLNLKYFFALKKSYTNSINNKRLEKS